jgi:hypothetical protein
MRIAALVFASAVAGLTACDRFWDLNVYATASPGIAFGCVDSTGRQLTGVAETLQPYDSGAFPTRPVNLRAGAYGALTLNPRRKGESTRLALGHSWVGPKPSPDTVQTLVREYSRMLTTVSHGCGNSEPMLQIALAT